MNEKAGSSASMIARGVELVQRQGIKSWLRSRGHEPDFHVPSYPSLRTVQPWSSGESLKINLL